MNEGNEYSGYCMIKCDLGKENDIIEKIKSYGTETGIKKMETIETYGLYDVVAEISADNEKDFKNIVNKIRKTYGVRETMTLINLSDVS